jgi:hypothetical protein
MRVPHVNGLSAGVSRVAGQLGRLPSDPSKPRIRLAEIATATRHYPPVSVDWGSRVLSWPMYLNDSLGDCVIAEIGHQIESASFDADGTAMLVTDQDILAGYEAVGGYVPGDPATDNGCVIQDALAYWRSTGIGGHKCVAFASADLGNQAELMQGVAAFGSLDIGISVSQGDMDAFESGRPWDTSYSAGSVLGGHAVEVVAYDQDGGLVVTWGQLQRFTWDWFRQAADEAWIVILPEWWEQRAVSPSGFSMHRLGVRLHELTGAPNPFPQAG